MGTNYYLRPSRNPLRWLGNPYPFPSWGNCLSLHIGKSSAGWCFALHVHPGMGIHDLEDWKPWLRRHRIENEYGRRVSYRELMTIITDRHFRDFSDNLHALNRDLPWDNRRHHSPTFLEINNAQEGPRGLLRARVDGVHCVGNGQGTWDYFAGDFS